MARYRAHIWEIEAWQYLGYDGDWAGKPKWVSDAIQGGWLYMQGGPHPYLTISQPDCSQRRVDPGNWLIKGPPGWLYRCGAELFAVAYERVA